MADCNNNLNPNSPYYYYQYNKLSTCNNSSCNCDMDDIKYTGAALNTINVITGDTLTSIITKINTAIGAIEGSDWSSYNYSCLENISNQQEFVEVISDYVCNTETVVNNFITNVFPTAIEEITTTITENTTADFTSCIGIGIVPTDTLKQAVSKLSTTGCSILAAINPSTANWNSCFSLGSAPTTVLAGFNRILQMICLLKDSIDEGFELPIFNNEGSCLSSPTTTDTLVDTIAKIKAKLCSLSNNIDFDVDAITFDCVNGASTLQDTIQNIIFDLSILKRGTILEVDEDYFTLEPIDADYPCLGQKLSLNEANLDRYVKSNDADTDPGTLIDKLEAGTNISLDDDVTPGKVRINFTGVATDTKAKADTSDSTTGYLNEKISGATTTGIGITVNLDTTNPAHLLKITPVINDNDLAERILIAIQGNSELRAIICDIVSDCAGVCTAPSGLSVDTFSDNFQLAWVPSNSGTGQIVYFKQKPDSTYESASDISPINPQTGLANSAIVNSVDTNIVYQFKVATVCDEGEELDSMVVESIIYACAIPEVTPGSTSIAISLGALPTIYSVQFTLKSNIGNTLAIQTSVGPTFSTNFTGLTPSTNYSIEFSYLAYINGVPAPSNGVGYLASMCTTGTIATTA